MKKSKYKGQEDAQKVDRGRVKGKISIRGVVKIELCIMQGIVSLLEHERALER